MKICKWLILNKFPGAKQNPLKTFTGSSAQWKRNGSGDEKQCGRSIRPAFQFLSSNHRSVWFVVLLLRRAKSHSYSRTQHFFTGFSWDFLSCHPDHNFTENKSCVLRGEKSSATRNIKRVALAYVKFTLEGWRTNHLFPWIIPRILSTIPRQMNPRHKFSWQIWIQRCFATKIWWWEETWMTVLRARRR